VETFFFPFCQKYETKSELEMHIFACSLDISLKGYTSYRLYKYYIGTTHYYVLFITSTTDMS